MFTLVDWPDLQSQCNIHTHTHTHEPIMSSHPCMRLRFSAAHTSPRGVWALSTEPRRSRSHLCICLNVVQSQSSPSYNPSPFVATVPCTCHVRSRSCETPSCSHTCAGVSEPFMSCLFAKMRMAELRMSGSETIVLNSFEALRTHAHRHRYIHASATHARSAHHASILVLAEFH